MRYIDNNLKMCFDFGRWEVVFDIIRIRGCFGSNPKMSFESS